MQSRGNPAVWMVLSIVLFGTAAAASAQSEPAAAIGATQFSDTSVRVLHVDVQEHHDKLFVALNTAFLVTASADLSVSMYQISHGVAREGGFGAQWQDSPVAFAVTKSAMATAFAYGLNRMHKTRPKTAFVLGIAATAFEGWLAVRAARMSAPHP